MGVSETGPLRVAVLPDLVGTNPYLDSLNQALERRGIAVARGGTLDRRRVSAARGHLDVVHLHWLEYLFFGSGGRLRKTASMYAQGLRFVAALRALSETDVRLVWTVHNARPHQLHHPQLYELIRRAVVINADALVVHSHYAAERVREWAGVGSEIHVVPHASYIGDYPESKRTPGQVRTNLSIPTDAFVYLLFGHVLRHKQIPDAIGAFRRLSAPDARLVIAGSPSDSSSSREVQAAAEGDPRVIVRLESVSDADVGALHRAADAVVLNYSDVFSSGALMLALTFGLPVVAPAKGSATEIAPPPATVPFGPGGLGDALLEVRTRTAARRKAALAAAGRQTWDRMARQLEQVYRGQAASRA